MSVEAVVSAATARRSGPPSGGPSGRRGRAWPRNPALAAVVVLLVGLALALLIHARHLGEVPSLLRGSIAGLVLFVACGDALARALVPRDWAPLRGLFALALGAAASGLVLTAFGVAHVPLHVSLWLTLALGAAASVVVRRGRWRAGSERHAIEHGDGAAPAASAAAGRGLALGWLAALFVIFWIALIPAGVVRQDTVFGQNPDASQVVGIATLFQHVPPTATDIAQPLDTVPQEWRFRYPIFYPLAAASNLSHFDPIRVFPTMAALLLVIAAFGFGMLAVCCLRAPPAAGPAIAGAIAVSWVMLHLAWHPYWNQLWGTAMFPYALLFGWRALAARDGRAGILFAFTVLTLWLAYPLALPYPLVLIAAVAVGLRWRPPRPRLSGTRGLALTVIGLALLAPAVVGAVLKLEQAVRQLLTPNSDLWGGDVKHLLPVGKFVGTGGGVLPVVAVAAVALVGLWGLERRLRLALGAVLAGLCLLDLRFRLASSGAYMDFKHLSFVGTLVLTLAAAAVARMLFSGSRRTVAAGALLAVAWIVPTLLGDGVEGRALPQQVPPEMFAIPQWAARLPQDASVRVDIPVSGTQLWAVYMLGDHPVDSPTPVLGTTYAHARGGYRADYSLSLRYLLIDHRYVPYPPRLFAVDPPVFQNSMFVLRRIRWPAQYDYIGDTSSRRLQP